MKRTATIFVCLGLFLGGLPPLMAQDTTSPPQEENVQSTARRRPAYTPGDRRDPFRNLLGGREIQRTGAAEGIPQIYIDDILLVGIVKRQDKYTAIINDKENFPYYINVGDKFADGFVQSIEYTKVIFRKTHERGVPLRRVKDITKEIIL